MGPHLPPPPRLRWDRLVLLLVRNPEPVPLHRRLAFRGLWILVLAAALGVLTWIAAEYGARTAREAHVGDAVVITSYIGACRRRPRDRRDTCWNTTVAIDIPGEAPLIHVWNERRSRRPGDVLPVVWRRHDRGLRAKIEHPYGPHHLARVLGTAALVAAAIGTSLLAGGFALRRIVWRRQAASLLAAQGNGAPPATFPPR